jgi:hypothetical protein
MNDFLAPARAISATKSATNNQSNEPPFPGASSTQKPNAPEDLEAHLQRKVRMELPMLQRELYPMLQQEPNTSWFMINHPS